MAERKLNINAPLISVRRASASSPSLTEAKKKILEKRHTLPNYKSDMTLDQVTEPVAVPFNWEHIPGKRKGNTGSEPKPQSQLQPPREPSITPSPRLPPGKFINATKQPLEKESKVVNKFSSSNKSKSFNVTAAKVDSDKERKAEKQVEKRRSNVVEDDDDDDVYSDALETLSATQSFSMNCSVSGVSGLDNLDTKKSGTFSTDQQTRDFMMSRFLPAAKAMTLQPPQYSSKKQSVLVEQQPRDVNKLVREAKKPLVNKQTTDIIPYTGHSQEEESEDEVDIYDSSASIPGKGCGLLPNLQIRNSLCVLNPGAGMKIKNHVPLPSVPEVEKPKKSSNIRSFSPVPAVKKAWDAIHKNKSSSGGASPDMQEGRKKWTSESNRFSYSGELLPGRLSPFRRSRAAAAGVSPCRSKPQSPFRGAKLPGDSREAEYSKSCMLKFHSTGPGNIHGIVPQVAKRSSYSGNLTMEKTLYIDTASTVKLSSSNLSSVDNKKRIDTVIADLDKRRKESNSTIVSSQDIKHVQALEEKDTLDSEMLSSTDDVNASTFSSMLQLIAKENKDKGLTTDQDVNRKLSSQLAQGTSVEDSRTNNQQIVLANGQGKGGSEAAQSPLPPPLPKSPSESWLWRALPIVSVKNSFQRSNQSSPAKRRDSNATSSNLKWETIVKTSNLHHDHVRYSQELTTRKSQHSKS